jgi:serine/threonine protein kinase
MTEALPHQEIQEEILVTSAEADLFLLKGEPSLVMRLYRHGLLSSLPPELLQSLQHPHILPVLEYGVKNGRHFEILPYCPQGNLDQKISQGKLSEQEAKNLVLQITEALEYLHSKNIVHGDLKPSNILLSKDGYLLADFGKSRHQGSTQLTSSIGTITYTSPEGATGLINKAGDFWSLGITLLKALTGANPLDKLPTKAAYFKILAGDIEVPSHLPKTWKALLQGLLNKDYTQRWNTTDIRNWAKGEIRQSPTTKIGTISATEVAIAFGLMTIVVIIILGSLQSFTHAAQKEKTRYAEYQLRMAEDRYQLDTDVDPKAWSKLSENERFQKLQPYMIVNGEPNPSKEDILQGTTGNTIHIGNLDEQPKIEQK